MVHTNTAKDIGRTEGQTFDIKPEVRLLAQVFEGFKSLREKNIDDPWVFSLDCLISSSKLIEASFEAFHKGDHNMALMYGTAARVAYNEHLRHGYKGKDNGLRTQLPMYSDTISQLIMGEFETAVTSLTLHVEQELPYLEIRD